MIWEMDGLNHPLGSCVTHCSWTDKSSYDIQPPDCFLTLCTWLSFVQTWLVWFDIRNFCASLWLQNKVQTLQTDFIQAQPKPHETGLLATPNSPLFPKVETTVLYFIASMDLFICSFQQQAFKLSIYLHPAGGYGEPQYLAFLTNGDKHVN